MKNNTLIALASAAFSFSIYATSHHIIWKDSAFYLDAANDSQLNTTNDDLLYGYSQTNDAITVNMDT